MLNLWPDADRQQLRFFDPHAKKRKKGISRRSLRALIFQYLRELSENDE